MSSKLVPKVRFKEFSGEWEEKKLEEIGKVSMCKRILKNQTNLKGYIPFYKIGTFGKKADSYISKELFEEYKSKYSYPKKGDILISASGTIGRLVIFDGSPAYFQDSNIVWIDNNEELVKNKFLYYYYKNIKWVTDDSTISRLYNDNLKSIKILIPPTPEEQQKIADTFSSLDNLIEAQTKKVELLKSHKKGLMQKLFPRDGAKVPEVRFKEFSGEWEENILGDFVSITTGKLDANAMIKDGKYRFYTCAKDYYYINDYAFDTEALLISGNGANVGYIHYYSGKFNAYQRTYVLNNFNINIQYIKYFLERNLTKRIEVDKKDGNTPYIVMSTLYDMCILLPSLTEQQKIADTLSSLDNLIEAQTKKIELLKEHKKGLMQKMFVNKD